MKRLLFACVLVAASAALAASGRANAWEPYAGNPVLGNAKLGTCFDVNVVEDGPAPYTMYFSWRPKSAIALVRSNDAFTWTQEPEICLKADPKSGWEDDLNRSCTVKKDGVWHMWYTGQVYEGPKAGSRIGYATSKDGVHFTRVRKDPVLLPSLPCEKANVMNPYVRWDAKRGVWRMWYAAGEQYEPNVICYAESKDGLAWTKHAKNPVFGHGDGIVWDRDRVGGCEVHPLPDGRWALFYIGYSDMDTARIGCAISADGVTGWKRLGANPVVAPDLGTWNGSACYKPSVLRDAKNNRWLLWYNGRSAAPEYVGMAVHEGLDLEAPAQAPADTKKILSDYVRRFNAHDDECYTNAFPNAQAEDFMLKNCPRFACPDKDVERTYYFRWWTFRKHLRHDLGHWTITEFLPKVGWSGTGNTIVCPAGHHLREGRWLRDPQYVEEDARFWLADPKADHRWSYSSWLFTGTRLFAEASGRDNLPRELLDAAVKYYERWEEGFVCDGWPEPGKVRMGGDGKGGFLSVDGNEGTEISLGGHGYKPLFASAMWSEAKAIAAVAREAGKKELAEKFEKKAEAVRQSIFANSWNPAVKFFTTARRDGTKGAVRELHGYAPWYFGMPTDGRAPDWAQLGDAQGFAARYGLTFPERRAKGFTIDYKGHECKWNGPSWPFATSVALTALMNDLHAAGGAERADNKRLFASLVWQYADAQRRTRDARTEGNYDVVPWIDENLHPDKAEWLSRRIILDTPSMVKNFPRERGKDYNHSTFCDLVIAGLVGVTPNGAKGFTVDPLCPETWDYFTLDDLRYRGHDVSVRWQRGAGLRVVVDGKEVARRGDLGPLEVVLPPSEPVVTVTCTRASHLYDLDEKAEFEVTADEPGTSVKISFTRAYLPPIETIVTTTPARVSFGLGEPGFIVCRAQARLANGAFGGRQARAGAGFEPGRIRTALPPVKDFDAFWESAFKEQDAIPPDVRVERAYSNGVQLISCQTVWNTRMYGFLYVPKHVKGPVPFLVNVGGGDSICTQKGCVDTANDPAYRDRGFLFIHLPAWKPLADTWPDAAASNKAWLASINVKGWGILHWNDDKGPRERWYYRCILGSCRLIDYAATRPGVDPKRVYYVGASTGGGYGVFLAAFSPHIKAAVCEVPNYGNASGPSCGRPSGEDDRGAHWQTSLYFDSAHCAPRITCPVFMSCGYLDDCCCPETVYCIFNALRCRKVMYDKVENGHGDLPKGYHEVRKAWLESTFGM